MQTTGIGTGPAVLALLAAQGAVLFAGVRVWMAGPRRSTNQVFSLLTVVLAAGLAADLLFVRCRSPESARRLLQTAWIVFSLVPIFWHALRVSLAGGGAGESVLLGAVLLPAAAVMGWLSFSDGFVRSVAVSPLGWFPRPDYGSAAAAHGAVLAALAGSFIAMAVLGRRRLAGAVRVELSHLELAAAGALAVVLALGVSLRAATGGFGHGAVIDAIGAVVWAGIAGHGLASQRLQGLREAIRSAAAIASVFGVLAAMYGGVTLAARRGLAWFGADDALWPQLIAAAGVTLAYGPLRRHARDILERLMCCEGGERLDEVGRRLDREWLTASSPEELYADFSRMVSACAGATGVRLYRWEAGAFAPVHPVGGEAVPEDSPLVALARRHGAPVPRYAAERAGFDPLAMTAAQEFSRLDADLAALAGAGTAEAHLVLCSAPADGGVYERRNLDAVASLCKRLAAAVGGARRRADMEASRRYTEFLVDHMAEGVLACGGNGRVVLCNREAARLAGGGASLVGRPIHDLPPALERAIRRILEVGDSPRDSECSIAHGADRAIVRVSGGRFTGPDGQRVGAVLTLRDVTAMRQIEERARRAERLASVGTLAAGIVHEIKNPLVTIKAFVQVLPRAFEDPEMRSSFCPLVETEVGRIDQAVNRLLDFARPVAPVLKPIRLHEVIASTLSRVEIRRQTHGLTLETALNAMDDRMLGDATMLEQALLNLCNNAIEAMEHGGVLRIETAIENFDTGTYDPLGQLMREPRLRVSVRDTGPGIPADVLPRIFDPFFTTKRSGSGLGLSVTHGIVHDHDGTMDVESRAGVGTVFHMWFRPLKTAAA